MRVDVYDRLLLKFSDNLKVTLHAVTSLQMRFVISLISLKFAFKTMMNHLVYSVLKAGVFTVFITALEPFSK